MNFNLRYFHLKYPKFDFKYLSNFFQEKKRCKMFLKIFLRRCLERVGLTELVNKESDDLKNI